MSTSTSAPASVKAAGAAAGAAAAAATKSSGGAGPTHFATVGPGKALPSGAQCATWVRAHPKPENKKVNAGYNRATGHPVPASMFGTNDAKAAQTIAPRIDGNFTGSTQDILRWAACKWGFDEDQMMAQAAIESWWRQTTLGDFGTDASRCMSSHGLGVDGKAGQCPESHGLMQVRYPYYPGGFPGVANSSAMNADVGFAILRSCFEGYETWLNTVERGKDYAAGDLTGCMGRWFSGRWYTDAANTYIARVKGYLDQRIWETKDFQEG